MRQFEWKLIVSLSFVSIVLFVVSSCSGEMQGMVRGEGTAITFWYEQGFDSDVYFAVVDDESFEGCAVMVGAEETYATLFGSTISAQDNQSIMNFLTATSMTGQFKAVLLGNKGSTLRCLMQYADTSGFTTSGGVGECVHSDGRTIDVVW